MTYVSLLFNNFQSFFNLDHQTRPSGSVRRKKLSSWFVFYFFVVDEALNYRIYILGNTRAATAITSCITCELIGNDNEAYKSVNERLPWIFQ